MEQVFIQLALILGLAVVISIIMKLLKQPMIIGYIFTGIIAGPSVLGIVHTGEALELFASLGVALLLFIVGLGLNPDMIKDVGRISAISGLAQFVFTTVVGLAICLMLGFDFTTSLYIAAAFTFSSTIVIFQLLYDKEEQDTLYGRISIGFLLIQDLIAMIIFVFLSSSGEQDMTALMTVAWVFVKVAMVGLLLWLIWKYIVPQVDRLLTGNKQVLFIFGLGLCFVMASLFHYLGFSLELGALVAGVLLSTSPYHREVSARIHPLRDFFLVIFFIFLGTHVTMAVLVSQFVPIIVLSLFIIIGNPLILLFIMTRFGHTRKTSFLAGLTVAQISEFSLIMLGIAVTVGHIPEVILGLATFIGIITIAVSSYMISYNEQIYKAMAPMVKWLTPRAHKHEKMEELEKEAFEVLIFGAHRMGGGLIELLKKQKTSFLVIDHDPQLVKRLREKGIPVLFGSAEDVMLLDDLSLSATKLVISTIPDIRISSYLLGYFKKRKRGLQFVAVAHHQSHAKRLYKEGASFVVLPPYLGRSYVVDLFKKNQLDAKKYASARKKHLKDLKYLACSLH